MYASQGVKFKITVIGIVFDHVIDHDDQKPIVSDLCPGAFVTKQMKQLQNLRYVLESNTVRVTLKKGKYECTYLDGSRPTVTFDKKPTLAYYQELFNAPRDYTNQVAVVEDTLRRALHAASKTHPIARLSRLLQLWRAVVTTTTSTVAHTPAPIVPLWQIRFIKGVHTVICEIAGPT